MSPARTSPSAALSYATITAFDFGARQQWMTGLRQVQPRLPGSPTNSSARAAATAACSAVGSAIPVFAGEDDEPPGDEPRILTRRDHPGQVVQRRVTSPPRIDLMKALMTS